MSEPLIQVRGVSLRLGEFAVRDADVEVAEGEYFVLLGPTGAGKTVLLECIAGLHRPEAGDIRVAGQRVNDLPPEQRRLGYLPQDYALFPHLSVARNIGFGMKLRRRPQADIDEKVGQLAGLLGITHLLGRAPTTLSGGEKQRVALARALAIEPKVLLLDEPLSALDEQTREALCIELRRIHSELGTTTLHVSHNFEETLAVADKIGIIHEGRLRQIGAPEEVFRRPASEFVARFVRCDNVLRGQARRTPEGLVVQVGEAQLLAAGGPAGEVFLAVRPEDVELAHQGPQGAPNCLSGRVERVVDRGPLVRIDVAAAAPLTALVARSHMHSMGLAVGEAVSAHFEPSAAHVFAVE